MKITKHLEDVFYKKMVITHCKHLCKGDYLIDDRDKNGAAEFEEELEEELDELKFRRDNGYLPQEDYAELAAEITERLNELQE